MDVDFMRRRGHGGIKLGPLLRPAFLEQVKVDVALLQAHQFMDYSLLLGIAPGANAPLRSPRSPQATIDPDVSDNDAEWSEVDKIREYSRGAPTEANRFWSVDDGDSSVCSDVEQGSGGGLSPSCFHATDPTGRVTGEEVCVCGYLLASVRPVNRDRCCTGCLLVGRCTCLESSTCWNITRCGKSKWMLSCAGYCWPLVNAMDCCLVFRGCRIEHRLKSIQQRTWDSDTVSSTDVNSYAARFLDFMERITV